MRLSPSWVPVELLVFLARLRAALKTRSSPLFASRLQLLVASSWCSFRPKMSACLCAALTKWWEKGNLPASKTFMA